jgi:hypothetical protein
MANPWDEYAPTKKESAPDVAKGYGAAAIKAVAPTVAAMGTGAALGALAGGPFAIPGAVLGGIALPFADLGVTGYNLAAGKQVPTPSEALQGLVGGKLPLVGLPSQLTPEQERAQRYMEIAASAVTPAGVARVAPKMVPGILERALPKAWPRLESFAGRPAQQATISGAAIGAEEATGLLGDDAREKYGPLAGGTVALATGAIPKPAATKRALEEAGTVRDYISDLGVKANDAFGTLRDPKAGIGIVDKANVADKFDELAAKYKTSKEAIPLLNSVMALQEGIRARSAAPGLGGYPINDLLNEKQNLLAMVKAEDGRAPPEVVRNLYKEASNILNNVIDESLGTGKYKEARELWSNYKKADAIGEALIFSRTAKNPDLAWAKEIDGILGDKEISGFFSREERAALENSKKKGVYQAIAGMIPSNTLFPAGLYSGVTGNPVALIGSLAAGVGKKGAQALASDAAEVRKLQALFQASGRPNVGRYTLPAGLRALRPATAYAAPTAPGLLSPEEER